MKMEQITLFAMTQKGYVVLKVLYTNYPGLIKAVITAKDSSVLEDFYDQTKNFCEANDIPCYERTESFVVETKWVLAISWRWLIPSDKGQLIVFHDSILPRYRGFNPLVTALINGDINIGGTALFASTEYDRGEIIAQSTSLVSYPLKIQQAIEIILQNYIEIATKIAKMIVNNDVITGRPQIESEASYSLWRDEDDYCIDWGTPASIIRRFVDAVGFPYLGAATFWGERLIRILEVEQVEDVNIVNRTPGKLIFTVDAKPVIVCGQGLLKIITAVDDKTRLSILPLPRFRVKFQ